jgi:hypothetical protein
VKRMLRIMNQASVKCDMLLVVLDTRFDVNPWQVKTGVSGPSG